MRNSLAAKCFTVVLIGLFVHAPAVYAGCTLQGVIGPPFSWSLVYDYTFDDTGCYAWQGDISYGSGSVVFDGPAEIYQDVVVNTSFSSYALSFYVTIDSTSVGLERLYVEVDGVTVATLSGNNSSGRYDLNVGDYDNSTVRIRVYRPYTSFPGDTAFTLEWIEMWGRA